MSTALPIASSTDVGGLKTASDGDILVTPEGVGKTVYNGRMTLTDDNITIGPSEENNLGGNSVLIGNGSTIADFSNESVAIGFNSKVGGISTVACGAEAEAQKASSTALGYLAKATVYSAVALGASSIAEEENTVSVGSSAKANGSNSPFLRRIVNVQAGKDPNDAVTYNQVNAMIDNAIRAYMASQFNTHDPSPQSTASATTSNKAKNRSQQPSDDSAIWGWLRKLWHQLNTVLRRTTVS
jgi:hypothetical protein